MDCCLEGNKVEVVEQMEGGAGSITAGLRFCRLGWKIENGM